VEGVAVLRRPSIPRRRRKIISATTLRGGFASSRQTSGGGWALPEDWEKMPDKDLCGLLNKAPWFRARSGSRKTRRFGQPLSARASASRIARMAGYLEWTKQGATPAQSLRAIQPFRRAYNENLFFSHLPQDCKAKRDPPNSPTRIKTPV